MISPNIYHIQVMPDFSIADEFDLLVGNAGLLLSSINNDVFQTCITSPPYWGLRDYGVENQIGAENSVEEYISNLVNIFSEVRRTLRPDGTLWLNIGDSYTSGGRTWRGPDKKNQGRGMDYRPPTPDGLKPKDLIGVPWKLAFALQHDGWYLRSDIIWYKPNCQPESVKDRPTRSHEYVFLFSKAEKYYYDSLAIMEPAVNGGEKKNKRSVWSINTRGFNGAHFAVFTPELVENCLLAGSKEGSIILDPFIGSGTVAEICLERGRKCLGIELNPEYADMTKKRLSIVQRKLNVF